MRTKLLAAAIALVVATHSRTSCLLAINVALAVRADEPKLEPKSAGSDLKDVRVGPPPELARLRKAVDAAARRGENIDEIRKELDALEKAMTGKAWVVPEIGADPVPAVDEKTEFHAALFTPGDRPHDFGGSYGPFSLKGPKIDALKPLPKHIRFLAYDPLGKKHYGIDAHSVFEVDLEQNTRMEIKLPANLPRLSWTCGITFDTKRNRLLVTTLGGSGCLYSFTPKTAKWDLVCDMDNKDLGSMVYNPKTDLLYGFPEVFGSKSYSLSVRNAAGAIVSTLELNDPAIPKPSRGPIDMPIQLVCLGEEIVFVTDKQIVAMDLKTQKVRVTWERK